MTSDARLMSGIILITVPTIQYGSYFLLSSLMNKTRGYMDNPLRQNFFRAGHAHAGVIVILSWSVRYWPTQRFSLPRSSGWYASECLSQRSSYRLGSFSPCLLRWEDMGIFNVKRVRDLWAHHDLPQNTTGYSATMKGGSAILMSVQTR